MTIQPLPHGRAPKGAQHSAVTVCHLSQCLLQRRSQCQALHIHLGDLPALSRQFCVLRPDQHVMQVPQLQRKQRRG